MEIPLPECFHKGKHAVTKHHQHKACAVKLWRRMVAVISTEWNLLWIKL